MRNIVFLLLGSLVFFSSCKKDKDKPTTTVTGNVILYNEFEIVPSYSFNGSFGKNYSGVTVSVDGTNCSAISDSAGNFTINNVPTGTYNITYTKPGYVTAHTYNVQLSSQSNNITQDYLSYQGIGMALQALPTTTVNSISVTKDYNGAYLIIQGTITPTSTPTQNSFRSVTYFIGTDSTVSYQNYLSSLTGFALSNSTDSLGNYIETSNNNGTWMIPGSNFSFTLEAAGNFGIGTKIYIVAYGSLDLYSVTSRDANNKIVYTGINPVPSKVMSVVIGQ